MSTFDVRPRVSESIEPINVVVACRRRLIALGLEAMLESSAKITFVGNAVHMTVLQAYLDRTRVDVLLCAWREYGEYARSTLQDVKEQYPELKICVIAEDADPEIIRDAFTLGATGFISEACNDDQVIDALVHVGSGRTAIETGSQRARESLVHDEAVSVETLSDRECEILTLMAVGLTTKEIANALFLSPKTVESHRANMMRKLEITSIAEAVLYANRMGLVAADQDR